MAGIYVHIPFCSQACHYCDFHFSTNLKPKSEMVQSIIRELDLRKDYLKNEKVESVYFGGGTPSLLDKDELQSIMDQIRKLYDLSPVSEITLEANPEDLSLPKLEELRSLGVNRLSIGIQTFHEETLQFMNRAHNSSEAENCLIDARKVGFDNVSTDLIFAVPPTETSIQRFSQDIDRLLSHGPEHISLYSLTIEPKTVFGNRYAKNELKSVADEINAIQYEMAIDRLTTSGYEHYEVSNFGKPDFYSRHNSSYWLSQIYLGVGPGAHSFNGTSRAYNVSNNAIYIKSLTNDKLALTEELLTKQDQLNEYVLTRIRTKWGISFTDLNEIYGADFRMHRTYIENLISARRATLQDDILRLTSRGLCIADEIALHFFSTE